MAQLAFYFDSSKCTGCKSCQVACKQTYHLGMANTYRRVIHYAGGSWTKNANGTYKPNDVFGYFISMACNHCFNPACVTNCPTGAMQKDPDTGIVWTDHKVCIGCATCVAACPYGAPSIDKEAGYSVKCDFCYGELGLNRQPVCVATCPMRALDCGVYEDLVAKYGKGNIEIEPLPQNTTNPSTIIKPHPKAQATGAGTGSVLSFKDELCL